MPTQKDVLAKVAPVKDDVKALTQKVAALTAENTVLKTQVADSQAQIVAMKAILADLEAQLAAATDPTTLQAISDGLDEIDAIAKTA